MISKLISTFRAITAPAKARDIAEKHFEQYQRELLEHQAAAAYHAKMAQYCEESISRLANYKPAVMQ